MNGKVPPIRISSTLSTKWPMCRSCDSRLLTCWKGSYFDSRALMTAGSFFFFKQKTAYEVGCYGGRALVEKYGRWILMGRRELDWADRFFARWGYLAVFVARLLPVIRTFIALPAGVARMPRGRFHLYTFLGSWPWCLGLAWLGMKLGENWRELGKYFHSFDAVIGAILVAGVIWFVWSHWKNRMSKATEN